VGRLSATWSELSRGRRALVLVGAALVAARGGLRLFADLQRGPAGALASAVATSGAPGVLLVAPPYQAHAAYYELTGRRDYWDNECSEPSGAMMLRAGETVVIGVTAERTASDLAQALDRLGGFDVLLAPVTRPPAWATWLDDRCVRLGGAGRDRAVWRCGGAPRRPASGCPEPWSADAADGSAR